MDDLVKRLRSVPPCSGCGEYPGGDIAQIMDIAAARIEALEARVAAADKLAEAILWSETWEVIDARTAAYQATKEGE